MTKGGSNTTPPIRPLGSVQKGYQPSPSVPSGTGKPQGGHQPSKGQGAPSGPPNQGSGGKK